MLYSTQMKDLDNLAEKHGAVKKAISYYDNTKIGRKQKGVFATYYFNKDNKEVFHGIHDLIDKAEITEKTHGVQIVDERKWGSIAVNELEQKKILPGWEKEFKENLQKVILFEDGNTLIAKKEKGKTNQVIMITEDPIELRQAFEDYSLMLQEAAWLGYDLDEISPVFPTIGTDKYKVKEGKEEFIIEKKALVALAFEHDPKIRTNILNSGKKVCSEKEEIKSAMDNEPTVDTIVSIKQK